MVNMAISSALSIFCRLGNLLIFEVLFRGCKFHVKRFSIAIYYYLVGRVERMIHLCNSYVVVGILVEEYYCN